MQRGILKNPTTEAQVSQLNQSYIEFHVPKFHYSLNDVSFVQSKVNVVLFLGLGVVKECTLTGDVRTVSYGNLSYCMVDKGRKGQNEAMEECKTLNAQLPLPKSKGEADELRKVTGKNNAWIGIRDLTKSGIQSKWRDVEGNLIGDAYVNVRVIIFSFY